MKKLTGIRCLMLALFAFAGLGIEVILAFFIEPFMYGASMNEWSTFENIMHWTLTCITWGAAHFFTKDFLTGCVSMISGLAYGSIYLLVNRDIRKAYPILWIMFVL